jgi:hypothetical protein
MATKPQKRSAHSGTFTDRQINRPRIKDASERAANVERATKRIKSDVQVNVVRARRRSR